MSFVEFFCAVWPYALAAAVFIGIPIAWLALEAAAAPLYGPDEQPINVAAEDARERHNGHRDHEQPGGLL